jgi:hypothetical protein
LGADPKIDSGTAHWQSLLSLLNHLFSDTRFELSKIKSYQSHHHKRFVGVFCTSYILNGVEIPTWNGNIYYPDGRRQIVRAIRDQTASAE